MDKRGNSTPMKFPIGIESMIKQLAAQEGRSFTEMTIHLIARGIHFTFFDPEKYLTTSKEIESGKYTVNLPKRAIPLSTRFEVFKRDKFTCQYCGKKPPDVTLEVDHIIATSKGGKTTLGNLKTSCFDCNRGKSDS